jgi:hypothetical protein
MSCAEGIEILEKIAGKKGEKQEWLCIATMGMTFNPKAFA